MIVMKNKCIMAIILFCVAPCKVWGNDFSLKDFFAPSTGVTNIYSCKFPCELLEIVGELSNNDKYLTLKETMHLSEKLTEDNAEVPQVITKTKNLRLFDDRIVEVNDNDSNILIKGPVEHKLNWKIYGIKQTLVGEKASSGINKEKVSWSCQIVDYGKDQCLNKLREIVKIECESDFKPKELIRFIYAGGIGLIEKTTINATNGLEVNKMKILERQTNTPNS